jgi:hypothetical protein
LAAVNFNKMANWNQYKNKTYTQQEARKMDYELDLLHELVSELYDIDYCTYKVKATLDKIERNVASKHDVREVD